MHQKKSEVQIGKESIGVSSDFNPQPSLHLDDHRRSNPTPSHFKFLPLIIPNDHDVDADPEAQLPPNSTSSTPLHKRPLTTTTTTRTSSFDKPPILSLSSSSIHQYPNHPHHHNRPHFHQKNASKKICLSSILKAKASAFPILIRRFQQLRRLRVHLRLVLLISLPFFYFLVSHPSHSFLLDFLSAFAFSAALLFSLNLALPRLPSIRLFLARSFPIKLNPLSSSARSLSRSHLPVFWSIGSREKLDKMDSGCCVRVYSNGDVYEGEFHKGKCSGSGVYYYYMSGRYEGDWIDGKYDGYGVETWARGSRYRGQYRQGLRHGFGVYRFYTGDVYAGEWSNGQSHGCGVHTCEDGSRYVGEFKWGVKHGLGHYHFRYTKVHRI